MYSKDEKAAIVSFGTLVITFAILTVIQISLPAIKTAVSLISKLFN